MLQRREFMKVFSAAGLGGTLLPGVLWAQSQDKPGITREMIDDAAKIAGIAISDEYKEMMLENLNGRAKGFDEVYQLHLPNSVEPSLLFLPDTSRARLETQRVPMRMSAAPAIVAFKRADELAFATVRELAELVRARKISSTALTEMCLERLKRYNAKLKFVVTLTEDRARARAKEADREIASGKYRGPLHGLPWGAKDLLAVKGYPTTWGAGGFEKQVLEEDATVVKRLDEAGAVLVAKLTLGALAMGDHWFGGITRNPWNTRQGSSGSSAGPASATAAGCVAFSIGSETLGSISSPSTRCGCTGLRPTFGFVPRTGAMALSWSMDKLGPICRSAEDCALVLDAIHGPDGKDRTVAPNAAFNWNASLDWRRLRVGYLKQDFESAPQAQQQETAEKPATTPEELAKREKAQKRREASHARAAYDRKFDDAALEELRSMGVNLIPVEMPKFPYDAMVMMLESEAAAAFDELTRSGRDKLLTEQGPDDWPNSFRSARFFPAVEYIQASRARRLAMDAVGKVFSEFDAIVAPTFSQQLVITNLTGHPALILPNGFRGPDAPLPASPADGAEENDGGPGTPVSLTFLGNLYGEAKLLALARAYQEATGFHKHYPKLDG
jgi:Asp-tRNAAsn/Glu-tRNAGln amidotransferase A subunit and related amidases